MISVPCPCPKWERSVFDLRSVTVDGHQWRHFHSFSAYSITNNDTCIWHDTKLLYRSCCWRSTVSAKGYRCLIITPPWWREEQTNPATGYNEHTHFRLPNHGYPWIQYYEKKKTKMFSTHKLKKKVSLYFNIQIKIYDNSKARINNFFVLKQ